jgi:hypothetical protein
LSKIVAVGGFGLIDFYIKIDSSSDSNRRDQISPGKIESACRLVVENKKATSKERGCRSGSVASVMAAAPQSVGGTFTLSLMTGSVDTASAR